MEIKKLEERLDSGRKPHHLGSGNYKAHPLGILAGFVTASAIALYSFDNGIMDYLGNEKTAEIYFLPFMGFSLGVVLVQAEVQYWTSKILNPKCDRYGRER